jgi:hypothetical protein
MATTGAVAARANSSISPRISAPAARAAATAGSRTLTPGLTTRRRARGEECRIEGPGVYRGTRGQARQRGTPGRLGTTVRHGKDSPRATRWRATESPVVPSPTINVSTVPLMQ